MQNVVSENILLLVGVLMWSMIVEIEKKNENLSQFLGGSDINTWIIKSIPLKEHAGHLVLKRNTTSSVIQLGILEQLPRVEAAKRNK